ncbi:MAG: phage integrase SAM-like domain-containing protein [Muribaculaceae bacterium]|nr:phage integrase SAM-like domain-containing protein [Muribaculaceae bacterium]MDE7189754.1 phage integrase SAM-like domain-containing protein [Muribaculaceae bacterium]
MDAITPELVLGFTNYLRRKCSGEDPKKNYHWFKKVIADAVEEDIIKKNPCKGYPMSIFTESYRYG